MEIGPKEGLAGKEKVWRRRSYNRGEDPQEDLVSDASFEVVGGLCLGTGSIGDKD